MDRNAGSENRCRKICRPQLAIRNRKARCEHCVEMRDAPDVRTTPIDLKMDQQFTWKHSRCIHLPPLEVHENEIFGSRMAAKAVSRYKEISCLRSTTADMTESIDKASVKKIAPSLN